MLRPSVFFMVLALSAPSAAQINWNLARPPGPTIILPPAPNMADQAMQGYAAGLAARQQREAIDREAADDLAAREARDLERAVGSLIVSGYCDEARKLALQQGRFDLAGAVQTYCREAAAPR